MNINDNYQLNFKAKLIKKSLILKYNPAKYRYEKERAYFAEINPKNEKEAEILKEAVKDWEKDEYGLNIVLNVKSVSDNYLDGKNFNFYVLTLQNNNLENLDPKKILGIIETYKMSKKKINIDYIQVKPEYSFHESCNGFINIGKAIIKSIKSINKNRTIEVNSSAKSEKFYKKMGFKKDETSLENLLYFWKREK